MKEQLKNLVVDALENNGIISTEAELVVDFKDGTEGKVVFDLIINVKECSQFNQGN